MTIKKNLIMVFFSGVAAIAQGNSGNTPASTRTTLLAPFGLGTGETARINLTNIAANSQAGTAASCDGSVSFLNAAGTLIGTATTFKIATLVTTSISLPFAGAGLTGPRGVLRASITVNHPATTSASPNPPCTLLGSLETFDTVSGATHLYQVENIAAPFAFGRD